MGVDYRVGLLIRHKPIEAWQYRSFSICSMACIALLGFSASALPSSTPKISGTICLGHAEFVFQPAALLRLFVAALGKIVPEVIPHLILRFAGYLG